MKRLLTYTFWAVLILLSMASSAEAAVRVYAKVDTEIPIHPGEEFLYSVVVEGGAEPSNIDVAPLAPFNPRRAGGRTSMQQINDQMTVSYSENFVLTASKAGKTAVPGVTVTVAGKKYTTNPVEIPGPTDWLTLECSVSQTRCYVGQPVVMTIKWTIMAGVQGGGTFDIPVFRSDDFYIEDVSEPVRSQAAQQGVIQGVPVVVNMDRQLIGGIDAQIVSFRKVLIPKRSGRLRLDPAAVTTNMAAGRVRTRSLFNSIETRYERVTAQSDSVDLEVLPLPEAGKPPQFYGLVGQYTISASATPTQVGVGDPITLTVRIGGNPYLKPVQWPPLEQIPELADNFKIPAEKASPVVENGDKVFTQTIRAGNDRVTQIPAIPLAFFDSQKGQYVVAKTDPIRVEVAPTKVLTHADVQGTGSVSVNREVEAIRKGISANYYGPEVLADQSLSLASAVVSPGCLVLWSLPLAGLVVSSIVKLARRTSPELVARRRRRQARSAAVRQLKRMASANLNERHELLASAMKGYIGDRFDKVAASLTADDCYRIIAESAGDTQTATHYRDMIAACEAARYASVSADVGEDQVVEAIRLIGQVERKSVK